MVSIYSCYYQEERNISPSYRIFNKHCFIGLDVDERREALLMDFLALLDCGEKCDLFQVIEKSAGVDGDDCVTT